VLDPAGARPAVQHDRLDRLDPVDPAGRHRRPLLADALADRDVALVAREVTVDPGRVPELVVPGVDVHVDADAHGLEKLLVGEDPVDVHEEVAGFRGRQEVVVGRPERVLPVHEHRRLPLESELAHHVGEVPRVHGLGEGRASGEEVPPGDGLGDVDVVPQPAQAEGVLEHGPGRPALPGVRGEHAAQEDFQLTGHDRTYDHPMQQRAETPGPLLSILSYHKIDDAPRGAWEHWDYVPPSMLHEQLSALRDDGWRFIGLDDALRGLSEADAIPSRSVLVTFDDGYRSLLENGLGVLQDLGAPGVVFMPAGLVGGVSSFDAGVSEPLEPLCDWGALRELEAAGVSVQSHGVDHVHLSTVGDDRLDVELAESKRMLEEGLGKTVDVFAFPYGDGGADPAAVSRALERFGYRAACLYGGGPLALPAGDRYRLPRVALGFESDVLAEVAAGATT
jgi:peptidoglycan/xylan/chitin deacetylase (PgdA/CDA1 family)